MIKYGIAAVGIALLAGILWPVMSNVLGGGSNEATRLVEATERTNSKADSLNDSFTDVIPPAPIDTVYTPPPAAVPGSGFTGGPSQGAQLQPRAPGVPGGPGIPGGPGNGTQDGTGPQPTPTPDKYAHPSEHEVRDAMEYLNRMRTEMQPTQTEYIQAVEQLQRTWNPRYQRANEEFKRFARKIDHADEMAKEYFQVQERLTAQIASSESQGRARKIDAMEREVYLDWRDQAFRTLGQARLIMLDLHDMNLIITKQSLSAHFAALYEEFQNIPPEITMLHKELAKFREESNRIQQTFGVSVQ